jgi:hypothetical protein
MSADSYDNTKDRFNVFTAPRPDQPAGIAIPVTPDDDKDVTNDTGDAAPCYASYLYIGQAGDLEIVAAHDKTASGAGTAVLYKAVPIGWFPVQVRRVLATNTTAASIVAHYHP